MRGFSAGGATRENTSTMGEGKAGDVADGGPGVGWRGEGRLGCLATVARWGGGRFHLLGICFLSLMLESCERNREGALLPFRARRRLKDQDARMVSTAEGSFWRQAERLRSVG